MNISLLGQDGQTNPQSRKRAYGLWVGAGVFMISQIVLGPVFRRWLSLRLSDAGVQDPVPALNLTGSFVVMLSALGAWAFVAGSYSWRPRKALKVLLIAATIFVLVILAVFVRSAVQYMQALNG